MIISEKQTNNFWKNVEKSDTCWLYGKVSGRWNYGRVTINRKTMSAHRLSYLIHNGEIPSGMLVCHKCDNPQCVNRGVTIIGTKRYSKDIE